MSLPKIEFSPWAQWNNRLEITDFRSPGVYILAKFKNVPQGPGNPLDKKVIYVGETCNQSLRSRWYQFDRSAFQSKDGHSGGWNYNEEFGDKGQDLFVAAMPVTDVPEKLRHLFIRYVERKLILDYAVEHESQPILNRK